MTSYMWRCWSQLPMLSTTTTTNADKVEEYDDSCPTEHTNNNISSSSGQVFDHEPLLRTIMSFVPSNTFRYTALVNQKFRQTYLCVHGGGTKSNSTTSVAYALQAVGTARIWATEDRQAAFPGDWVARFGTLAVLQDLQTGGSRNSHGQRSRLRQRPLVLWSSKTCDYAAARGQLELLQWALANRCPCNARTMCQLAAEHGHLHVLIWLYAAGRNEQRNDVIPKKQGRWHWHAETCAAGAARNGHLHVLQWARQQNLSWSVTTCAEAAHAGHWHVLTWAHTNGCPVDPTVCCRAAAGGHLDILMWAIIDHGCPFDLVVCTRAARNHGHMPVLEWLQGQPHQD